MRTFTQKPKPTQTTTPTPSTLPDRVRFPQSLDAGSILHLQRTIGNRAVQRLLEANTREGHRQDADTVHATAEQGVIGGGGSLPHLNEIQRSFGRHDISHIRAHQGSRAAAAARAIGARAYTIGGDVAFACSPDLHTAAHEAAHVVQQRAGVRLAGGVGEAGDAYERHADAVADRVANSRPAEALLDQMAPAGSRAFGVQRQVVQRAPIKTDYGEFDTTKYDNLGPAGSEYGIDIVLTFDPDRTKVDAKKIGLTQSIRYQLAGVAVDPFPVGRERMVPSGTGEGSQIDRYGGAPYGNPLYAADVPGAKDKLGDTATVAGWGQHGWNYKDATGKLQHEKAILKDRPTMPGRGNNSGQQFETVALAVEGVQSGTYMGSVSWGWSVDGAGKFAKQPLTLKSKGIPSAEFMAVAKQWNKTAVGGTVKTTASPTSVYDAGFSVAFTVAKDTEVQVTSGFWIHNDITYDEVTIKSGAKAGSTGRIKVNDMQETGGTPVIPLPIRTVGTITVEPRLGRLATLREAPSLKGLTLADLPVGTQVIVMDDSHPWIEVEVDTTQPGVILNAYSRRARDAAGRLRGYVSQELIAR